MTDQNNPTTGAPAPIPDPANVDDLRERVLHSLDYAIGAISRRDATIGQLRARVAELEAEIMRLEAARVAGEGEHA